ncbi:MAG: flippase [Acidimicrobiales bacterium]
MRERQPGLFGNASALLVGRVGIAVMGWAGTVIIVRSLSEEGFGQFTLVFSILGMTSIITELGLGRVAIAGVIDDSDDPGGFAGTYVVLRFMLGVLGYLIAVAAVVVAGYPAIVVRATALAGVMVVVATPSNAYNLVFQAQLRMQLVAVAQVIGQAAQLALTVAVALRGGGLLWFIVPAVVAEVVIIAIKLGAVRSLLDIRYAMRPAVWLALLKEAVPLSLGGAMVTLYNRVDSVMLSQLDTFASVGVYGVAAKFADLVRFVASAVTLPILTLFVRTWPNDPLAFRDALQRGCRFLGFFGAIIVVQFIVFADDVIEVLYGSKFVVAADATRLLIVAAALNFFTALAFSAMVSARRHRAYPATALVGLMVNIALNLWLIPRSSFDGAAVATLATNSIVVVVIWIQLLRLPGLGRFRLGFLARFVPPAIGAALAGWSADAVLPWPAAALLAGLVYVLLIEVVRAVGPEGMRGHVRNWQRERDSVSEPQN